MLNLYLKDTGDDKVSVIKVIREHTGLGLQEAKKLTDNPSNPLVSIDIDDQKVKAFKVDLEEAGATVLLNVVDGTKIIELLRKENKKLSVSDINAYLKAKDIEGVKESCENLYRLGEIDYAGQGRYFIFSEDTKDVKSKSSNNSSSSLKSEIKVLLDLFKKDILSKEQFIIQIEEKLN